VLLLRRDSFVLARGLVLLVVPLYGALNLLSIEAGTTWDASLSGLELVLLRADRLSLLFGLLFHLGAFIGAIYALRVRDPLEHAAALVYAGSALGAVFAGDLVTLFFYWEGMALASALLVWAGRNRDSNGAGLRYLVMHLASGLLLLAGVVIGYQESGTIAFDFLGTDSAAGWLILAAFGIKCGFPLVHTWITDAYPCATPSGTVFLSMFTTKVAVYALARGYAGTDLLVPIGTVMALFPIFYAVIENDLRRVLGYSMINQIGFMVVGVGVGTELALNGAVAHAFNEVLFKGLLFMSMGAVLYRVGHVLGSDLGGLYRSMPKTALLCAVGAASISAFPLFCGFVSKSMIMTAMFTEGYGLAWLGLLFASAGVFHHAGIKIPYFAFFAHDRGLEVREAPANMLVAMGIAAILCIAIGAWPAGLYGLLPWDAAYAPYSWGNVLLQLQLLLFSALAFVWLQLTHVYPPELRSVNLDVDWLYRRPGPAAWRRLADTLGGLRHRAAAGVPAVAGRAGRRFFGARGVLSRPAETGTAAVLVGAALAAYLLVYYLVSP
jgi:multicomponent Na+:H+ antiporter subunit D